MIIIKLITPVPVIPFITVVASTPELKQRKDICKTLTNFATVTRFFFLKTSSSQTSALFFVYAYFVFTELQKSVEIIKPLIPIDVFL